MLASRSSTKKPRSHSHAKHTSQTHSQSLCYPAVLSPSLHSKPQGLSKHSKLKQTSPWSPRPPSIWQRKPPQKQQLEWNLQGWKRVGSALPREVNAAVQRTPSGQQLSLRTDGNVHVKGARACSDQSLPSS